MRLGKGQIHWLLIGLCMLSFAGFFAGCKTGEPDNEASTPWSKPATWETGLPGGMGERR